MNWISLVFITAIIVSAGSLKAQNDWELKLDKEGIKVFTKDLGDSPFKAIKTTCIIDATASRLTAVLMDINRCIDWVYATKKCILLKQPSASELYYYSEVVVPWPVSNRDFIVRLKVFQDEKTKAITILGDNKPAYLPVNKNIVRIMQSFSKWYIEPISNGRVKIEYTLQVDPGGSIPAWLINLFATKGPFESFKKLREQVKKPIYNDVKLPYLRE